MARAARRGTLGLLAKLRQMCRAYVRFALQHPHRYRLMFQADVRQGDHDELTTARHALGVQFVEAIARCQQGGVLPGSEAMPLALTLYAASHGIVELALTGHVKHRRAAGDPALVLDQLLQVLGEHRTTRKRPHRAGRRVL